MTLVKQWDGWCGREYCTVVSWWDGKCLLYLERMAKRLMIEVVRGSDDPRRGVRDRRREIDGERERERERERDRDRQTDRQTTTDRDCV